MTSSRQAYQDFMYELQNEHLDYQTIRSSPIIAPFKETQEQLESDAVIIEYSILQEESRNVYFFNQCQSICKSSNNPWSATTSDQIKDLYQLIQDPAELQLFGKQTIYKFGKYFI